MENNTSVSENEIIEEEVVEDVQEEIPDTLPDEEPVEENDTEDIEDGFTEPEVEPVEPSEDVVEAPEYVEPSDTIEENSETVSGSDILEELEDFGYPSVTAGDVTYSVYVPEPAPAFWEKPLSEYSVVDGLMLTAFTIAAFVFLWIIVK